MAKLTAESRLAVILIAPALVFVGSLYLLPTLITFFMSFQKGDIGPDILKTFDFNSMTLGNYLRSFEDAIWIKSFYQTLIFSAVTVGGGLVVSLGIAILLNEQFRGRAIFRVLALVPWAVPPVVNGTTWGIVFHASVGTLNAALQQLGLIHKYIIWFGDPTLALLALAVAVTWRFVPYMTLFLLAGLQSVSKSLIESAQIDGANALQRFRYIVLPTIIPVAIAVAFMQIVYATRVFDEIYATTRGGPSFGTTVMNMWIYKQSFDFLNFGYGAALSYLLSLFTVIFILLNHYAATKSR
jgi:ABC-type sugar transport system permease subunit